MKNNISPIMNMMNAVRNSNNPMAMLNMLAGQNPQLKQVMDIVSKNNGDAKKAFYEMAQQNGVDPNEILKMLK
jgi:hypothetical protein